MSGRFFSAAGREIQDSLNSKEESSDRWRSFGSTQTEEEIAQEEMA